MLLLDPRLQLRRRQAVEVLRTGNGRLTEATVRATTMLDTRVVNTSASI
jgi:hypothetical protein